MPYLGPSHTTSERPKSSILSSVSIYRGSSKTDFRFGLKMVAIRPSHSRLGHAAELQQLLRGLRTDRRVVHVLILAGLYGRIWSGPTMSLIGTRVDIARDMYLQDVIKLCRIDGR